MTDKMIIAVLGVIGALIVVLKPIFDLNTNITELKVSIDAFKESVDKLDNLIKNLLPTTKQGLRILRGERIGKINHYISG